MAPNQDLDVAPGWVGGFLEKHPEFDYPHVNLASLELTKNLANVNLLQRQIKVLWPEFSWQTVQGEEKSRCFSMFSPDISRLGYTDEGRAYALICPQQGASSPLLGSLNVEVTVTGQKGWVDETKPVHRRFAADITVEGAVWFSPSARQNPFVKLLWSLFTSLKLPFPLDKANAIKVTLLNSQDPTNDILQVRGGESLRFTSPDFARHPEASWDVGNVEVMIGAIKKLKSSSLVDELVNEFNQVVIDAFNFASGNLLEKDNILTWNVWVTPPEFVCLEEWWTHAKRWRKSIDADHGSPTGPGTAPRYEDGFPFNPAYALTEGGFDEIKSVYAFLRKLWDIADDLEGQLKVDLEAALLHLGRIIGVRTPF